MQHETLWVALAETLGPRSRHLRPLLAAFHTPKAVFEASEAELRAAAPEMGRGTLSSILRGRAHESAAKIVRWCHMHHVRILFYGAPDYPACLRAIDEPPTVLYCLGELPDMDTALSVGVVGMRKPDAYGVRVAYKLSFEMAAAGAVIVSGLAEGIDGVASVAAINAGSRTVAVLGSGIDIVYPKKHTRLAREVVEHGALVTEYAPGTRPYGHNFPVRNRLISALSSALLIAEASESSGALITARYAIAQGKPLFAVPGDITAKRSAGTNQLVADGVTPVCSSEDVLAELRFLYHDRVNEQALRESMQYSALDVQALRPYGMRYIEELIDAGNGQNEHVQKRKPAHAAPIKEEHARVSASDLSMLDEAQRAIYDKMPDGVFCVDALTEHGIPVGEAAAALTLFEIYGLVRSRPGGTYEKQ